MSYTCAGSGHPLGARRCVAEDHIDGCGESFGSLAAFDEHRRGGTCASPDQLRSLGYVLTNGAWRTPMDEETQQRLRGGTGPATEADVLAAMAG
jgi:hypothetical protein